MERSDDNKTLALPEQPKRGRGRPPKIDALTGAQRAKRFRDNHRGEVKSFPKDLPKIPLSVTEKEFRELQRAEESRTRALASAHAEIRILIAKLIEKDAEIQRLTSDVKTTRSSQV